MANLKTTIKIPTGLSRERKEQLAQDILSAIVLNAKLGYDKDGNRFTKYTKDYATEKGVGVRDVDLTLSGEMLDALKVIKIGRDYIDVGYDGRTKVSGKAEGNILGSYGRTPNPDKARDFLGLPEKAIKLIMQGYELTEEEKKQQYVEDNLDRISRELSPAQVERMRQQQLLDSLGLSNSPV